MLGRDEVGFSSKAAILTGRHMEAPKICKVYVMGRGMQITPVTASLRRDNAAAAVTFIRLTVAASRAED